MVIRIIAVGKIKELYLKEAIDEYSKRLGKYTKLEIEEVLEEKIPNETEAYLEIAKSKEGERILKKIKEGDYIFLLDLRGEAIDSVAFASLLDKAFLKSATIDFVIGGSYGVSDEVYKKADKVLSFSKLTFPHQLFRVVLLEQIYRGFKILSNEKYHK